MTRRDTYLLVAFFGFMGGVGVRSFLYLDVFVQGAFIATALALVLFWFGTRSRSVLVVTLIMFAFVSGTVRYSVADLRHGDPSLEAAVGHTVTVDGMVSDEPDVRDTHTNIIVDIKDVKDARGTHVASSRVRISVPSYPHYAYGDVVAITGTLVKPQNFVDETTGKTFDYVHYLGKDGIYYSMSYPNIAKIDTGKGNALIADLFGIKHAFLNAVSHLLPEPHASLLAGILLGVKQSLGANLLADFRTAGIIHIIVLSGYNVTIVAESLMRFFSFLPRTLSLIIGSGSIVLFTIMVGAGATVVRAAAMALLVVIGRFLGRDAPIMRMLLVAGAAMVVWNPKILAFDPSFQLSFIATVGLIYLAPLLEARLSFVPTKWSLRSIVAATTATQIFVLPLLAYQVGQISLVGLVVNLLVLPAIPLTMLFGFLAGISGLVSYAVAFPLAFVSYVLLDYEIITTEFFAHMPIASIQVHAFPAWVMFAWYLLYAGTFWYMRRKDTAREAITSVAPHLLPRG